MTFFNSRIVLLIQNIMYRRALQAGPAPLELEVQPAQTIEEGNNSKRNKLLSIP